MASDLLDGFSTTPAQTPEAGQAVAPLPSPQDKGDLLSGFDVSPAQSAKAKAAGTDTPPEEAGSTFSQAVKSGTPPEVIKADPAAFSKAQNDRETAEAIDSDDDIAHYINTVPDAAAISAGDWATLRNIAKHAVQAFPQLWDDFADKYITGPTLEYFTAGLESLKQSWREGSDPSIATRMMAVPHLAGGLIDISMASTGGAAAFEGYLNVMQKLGVSREDAGLALLALGHRIPGRAIAPIERPVIGEKPSGRDNLEQVAGYYKEFEPSEIKAWSNDELKKYVNTKLGMGSAAQDFAKTQTPSPGMDKAIDEFHVEQSKQDHDTVGDLLQAVQESKTKERSPEAMEAWLRLKGLEDRDVWLPSEMISDAYKGITPHEDDGKFGWVKNAAQRLPEATELGADISVPLSHFLAHVDPGAFSEFKDFVRFGDDLSPIEAEQWMENYHERFAEEAEADDIKNMAVLEDEQLPTRSGPQEWGVENFLPAKEEITAKPGANTARLAKLLGPKLYGEPSNMDKVTVKELMQNAADAVDAAVEQGLIQSGEIKLDFDREKRIIAMTDNGTGMAPETLAKEFLEIAGTKKESLNPKGGFGIAKMLINFANEGLHVITMRDGRVSELKTTGPELFAALEDPSRAPKVMVRLPTNTDRQLLKDGHGTHIKVTIPKSYKDSQTGEDKPISFEIMPDYHPALLRSPLFGSKVAVSVHKGYGERKILPIGSTFPAEKFTQFPPAQFDWGTAQIYVSKEMKKDWEENLHVLSNGIWQFSKNLRKDPLSFSDNIPHKFYIDVHPKAKPEDPGYPFDLNRQGFTGDAKKSFEQIFNYLSATYRQMDFLNEAKSFGSIQYLTPGKGKVDVSAPTALEPKIPPSKTSMTGLKDTDKIEFKGDSMYVNGKKMPSLTTEDLSKSQIKIDELMVDQKLINPRKVMLHSSMETWVGDEVLQLEATTREALEQELKLLEDKLFGKDRMGGEALSENEMDRDTGRLAEIESLLKGQPEGTGWIPLDVVAREKFGSDFDQFMYEVGDTFMRLRDAMVKLMINQDESYAALADEAIGISFDAEYRGVSIRVPFSGSFINPALPVYDDPARAAFGTIGTMIHELAHHKVRSHDASFPAEMQNIQIFLDAAQMLANASAGSTALNLQGMKNALVKTYTKYEEIFKWLRTTILDESKTRTRGRRVKGSEQRRGEGGPDEGALGRRSEEATGAEPPDEFDVNEGEYGKDFEPHPEEQQPTGGPVQGRPAQSADIHTPGAGGKAFSVNPTEQLAQILLHAERKSLYLAPLFRDAKSAGMTQKQWTGYAKKLQEMDEKDYEKALAAAHKEVQKTLTPAYQAEFNQIREEVESDLRSASGIAANRYFRLGKLPTGETSTPLKLDRTAVEYMGGAGAIKDITTAKGGVHPDDVATTFGYGSGRELVQALVDFDRARGRATPDKYLNQLVNEEAQRRFNEKHGDINERIAERAQEIALENHHVDILIAEYKHLASTTGQVPFTLEQITQRVEQLFERVPFREAKYHTYQKAVFKAGRIAEEHLLAGKFDKALKAKQTQLYAVHAAKLARSFESYKKSQENTFKRLANSATLSGVEQRYVDFAHDIQRGVGYGRGWPHPDNGSFADFVAEHNGDIAAAYWITDPSLMRQDLTYKNMTVEEFTALAKTIQSILHVGRGEKKINTVHGMANIDNALYDMVASMQRWPDKLQPKGALGVRGGVKGVVRYVNAAHMLVERMFDYADQFDPKGAFSTYIDRPMREAYNEEIKLAEATVKKLKYIRQNYVDSSIYDVIDNREIMDPLNGGKPMQLTRWNLRKIIAHAGSESGLDKVVNGHNVTEDQVYALIARNATKQDIEFANLMWELHNDLWQRAARKYEARTGVPLDPVKARPFDIKVKSGETFHATGGHEQVVYDRDLGSIAQDLALKGDMFEPGYVQAVTPNKYQVPRTKYYGPLDFTGAMESARIAGMIHDIAFRDVVLNTRKLLMSKEATKQGGLRDTIKKKFGVQYNDLLDGWLKDIANAHLVDDDFLRGSSRALAIIRQNVVGGLIFLSPSVAFKHGLTALGMSTAQVGAKDMASGLYDVGAAGMAGAVRDLAKEQGMNPDPAFAAAFQTVTRPGKRGMAARQFIYNSSPMMRARRRQYRNSIRGAMDALGSAGWRRTLVDARQVSLSIGRMAVAMSDSLSADAEWLAKYNQHFRETGDHDEAVYQADRAVTRAHGSNFVGDRSAILRSKNEWIRNTALLFTYWNHFTVNMQQLGWDIGARWQGRDEPGARMSSIAARLAYYFVLATIADMLAEELFTHDPRPLWLKGLRALGRQVGTGYYGLRDVTNLALGYEPSAGAVGLVFKNFAQIAKAIASGHGSRNLPANLAMALAAITGIGGRQVGATAEGVSNLLSGGETPQGPEELIKQLATGHPRPGR